MVKQPDVGTRGEKWDRDRVGGFGWWTAIVSPRQWVSQVMGEEQRAETHPPEVLMQQLSFQLSQSPQGLAGGDVRSVMKGQGLDFSGLREYAPGDDIRKIDWNVFARTQSLHVREYHEETRLTVWLVLDLTPSMCFGHRSCQKVDIAYTAATWLGRAALDVGHRLGGMVYTGRDRVLIPPKSGRESLNSILQTVYDWMLESNKEVFGDGIQRPPASVFTQVASELSALSTNPQNTLIFFLSDFLGLDVESEKALGRLARKTNWMAFWCQDPREVELPANLGCFELMDPETGEHVELSTHHQKKRSACQQAITQENLRIQRILNRLGRWIRFSTEDTSLDLLSKIIAGQTTFAPGLRSVPG